MLSNKGSGLVATPTSPELMEDAGEIDLIELLLSLLQHWKFILAVVISCTLLAGFYTTQLVTPQYEATSKLYVLNSKDSAINLADLQIGSYLTSDYQEVFKTWEVHERVNMNLGLNYSYPKLQSMLKISNPANTRILQITAKSPSAAEATALANEYAKVAQKYISETMRTDEPSILSVALHPLRPSSPVLSRNLILGFLLGLLVSCGIVFVKFMTDDRIKTSDDIARYAGLATLAIIPIQKTTAVVTQVNHRSEAKKRSTK